MMNDKNIDDLFRDKLKDLEQAPPAYLLDNILAGATAARRRRRLVYWRVASVAAALLLAFVAGWQINELNQKEGQQPVVVSQNNATNNNQSNKEVPGAAVDSQPTEQAIAAKAEQPEMEIEAEEATSIASVSAKNIQIAQNSAASYNLSTLQTTLDTSGEEPATFIPAKTVNRLASQQELSATELHSKKESRPLAPTTTKTIDQQIMEQNRQQLMAQKESRKKKQWLVGAMVSPAMSVNRSSHSSQYASSMLNSSNTSPIDLGGGLSVQYKAGKRWSVQSGVYYAGLEQSSGNVTSTARYEDALSGHGAEYFNAPVNIDADKMMMNSTAGVIEFKDIPASVVVGNNLEDKSLSSAVIVSDTRFIQNFQYLEIPLYLRYTVLDARFDIELMGGVSSNVLVGNDTYMDNSTGKAHVGKTQDMQDINYSGALGLGLKYGLSKRVFLNLEPRVKYYLNSLNNNPEVEYKPYTIGIFTGISYQF